MVKINKIQILCLLAFVLNCVACYSIEIEPSPYEDEAIELINNPPLEFKIRIYLFERFEPGICFGMPGPPDPRDVSYTFKKNPVIVEYVKKKYRTTDRYDLYRKVKQISSINISKTDEGFEFSFVDGNCCNIYQHFGIVHIINGEIRGVNILETVQTKRPC